MNLHQLTPKSRNRQYPLLTRAALHQIVDPDIGTIHQIWLENDIAYGTWEDADTEIIYFIKCPEYDPKYPPPETEYIGDDWYVDAEHTLEWYP